MIEDILFDNRHKFVYLEENKKDVIKEECLNNCFNGPIPVYIKDNGLPEIDNVLLDLDIYRIIIFHERYYEFLIALSVVDTLCNRFDKDKLNNKFKRMFDRIDNYNINNIDDFRMVLEHDKNVYLDGYKKYMGTGVLDFYNDLFLGFITLDVFFKNTKRNLDIKGGFSLIYDYDDLSVRSMMVINKYINSRCNGYLSINVLCGEKIWGCYYDSNGYVIQNIHDYTELDYRNVKKRIRHN